MATYPNFYESLAEALMRIKGTVVLYDGEPYFIWTVTDHKGDGVFRVYMTELEKVAVCSCSGIPSCSLPESHPSIGPQMDIFMENNPGLILRKKMNSPAFNRFRPFPLGMMNYGDAAIYVQRQPTRPRTEQGLTSAMLYSTKITAANNDIGGRSIDITCSQFKDCILGNYPSPKLVLDKLSSDKYINESVAFDREFALVRGPIGILFLAYREDVIGVLSNGDFSKVRLGKEFKHTREVVDELNLFYDIQVQ